MLSEHYDDWFVYKDHDDDYVYTWYIGLKDGIVVHMAHPYKRTKKGVEIDFEIKILRISL